MSSTAKSVIWVIILLNFISCSESKKAVNPKAEYEPYSEQKCDDWDKIKFNEFIIENNVWGKNKHTSYNQCIGIEVAENEFEINWNWNWPAINEKNVKAYPVIIYGWKPWNNESTTDNIPVEILENKNITIIWDSLTSEFNGSGNTAFDIWLTSSLTPSSNNITREIMIWLDSKTMKAGGEIIKTVEIDNETYELYKADWDWTYIAFVKKSGGTVSKLNLKFFLDFLLKENLITKEEILAAIEFGNEIVEGSGNFKIKNYQIKIE